MAELANCKMCGRLFVRVSSPYCPECRKKQEQQFEMVYTYVKEQDHRMATVPQVHEATGVAIDLIYQWIREGRLHTSLFPNLGYPCKGCGKMISEGTLCDSCRSKLEEDMAQESQKETIRENQRRWNTYHTKR